MKRLISSILICVIIMGLFISPVYSQEEFVDVLTVNNADFDIKAEGEILRQGKNVFDKDIVSMAGVKGFDGVKIFDINGNAGSDYVLLMTISADKAVPFRKIKMYWDQFEGAYAYLGKPTRAWPEGFGIYASNTGADGSWQRIYYADSLEGKLKKEQVTQEIWDDTDRWRNFYEFDLGSIYNAKHLRFAIEEMQPFLAGIEISEINVLAPKSNIPSNYKTLTLSGKATAEFTSADMLGANYFKSGSQVTMKLTPNQYYDIKTVKLGTTTITGTDGVYTFSMPNADTKVDIRTSLKTTEGLPLRMMSYEVAGGKTVYTNTVPVITYIFNNDVGDVSKNMVLVNGVENSGIIQHAFKDAYDSKKVYVVPFADKLEADKTYDISFNDKLESAAGMWLTGSTTATIKTDRNYKWSYDTQNEKYINGYGDGTFRPDEYLTVNDAIVIGKRLEKDADFSMFEPNKTLITRLQFARILYTVRKGFSLASDKDMFDMLIKEGVLRGNESLTYDPDGYVTRAEAVVLLNRAIGRNSDKVEYNPENIFTDIPENHWARNDITIAASDKYSTALPWTENIPEIKELDVYNQDGDQWQTLPIVSQEIRDMGEQGGEGGQWMQALEIDNVDGQLLFAGVDIAGLLRSTDGGDTWHRSFKGFYAMGCVDIAIDPNNKNRVLAIGSLSNSPLTGIYMSEDMGENWTQVFSYKFNGHRDTRDQLAWDKSSYDPEIGGSRVAYWSNEWRVFSGSGKLENGTISHTTDKKHGLLKTTDGGKTWFVVNEEMSDCALEVHPKKGYVYAGNDKGFFRSEDGGKTFTQIHSEYAVYGLDVIETYPDNVYINDKEGVLVSTDCGKTFTRKNNKNFPWRSQTDVRNIVRGLAVSPVNPKYMMVDCRDFVNYRNYMYYSHDGGDTWQQSTLDKSKDFYFNHSRQHPFVWHPTNVYKVWSFGGDWVMSSEDSGKTFIWDANGISGTPPGGRINYNPFNTDLLYCSVQDLVGVFSTNGGYTFKRVAPDMVSGHCYGGYAADENLVFTTFADGWYAARMLHVSRDGGNTFESTGLRLKYAHARRGTTFWGSVKDRDTFFAGEYVTRDRCQTWTRLPGCDVIFAINYYHNREIYGIKNNTANSTNKYEIVVVSYDDGRTWLPFCEIKVDCERLNNEHANGNFDVELWDLEYDGINDIMYYVAGYWSGSNNVVRVTDNVHENIGINLNKDERMDKKMYHLITVDPRHPEIVYVTGGSTSQKFAVTLQRSCDFGETFQVLSNMGDSKSIVTTGPSGGSGEETLLVHPENGTVLLWSVAEGLWTFPAPYEE